VSALPPSGPPDRRQTPLFEAGFWIIGALLLAAYVLGTSVFFRKPDGRVVFGDATHHFVQLRSIVFDRDLQFRNEYVRLYRLTGDEGGTEWIFSDLTPTGHVRNYMPIGPALLWAPLYVIGAGLLTVLSALGLTAPPDGFETMLQLVPGVTGVLASTLAALTTWRLARPWTGLRAAAIGTLGVWLGSHALYYSAISPAYSHAASMLASAIFFSYWLATRDRVSVGRLAAWGALAGVAALMRWQDAIFLVIPVIEALRSELRGRNRLAALVATGLAFLGAFVPQMIVWTVLYGRPLALPQGEGFMQWTRPHLVAVLFSDNHGLVTWAPLLALALLGLARFVIRHTGPGVPIASVVLLSWYVNAAVADWWAGEAFGARRFLSLFPLFALGLGYWVSPYVQERVRAWRVGVVLAFVLTNALLLLQYQVFMKGRGDLAPYPNGWVDMWVTRFVIPLRLIEVSWH
jgi:hypothetical protein